MIAAFFGALLAALTASPSLARRTVCPPLAGVENILGRDRKPTARFIVVGEVHGTNEVPQLFADLVCYATLGRPVVVSLEIQETATPDVDAYIASAGTETDQQALLRSRIWDPRYADGRSSLAIFRLIESLRLLRESGAEITVVCSQPDFPTLSLQWYGELARADRWALVAAANPTALNLILVGKAHAALRDNDRLGFLPAAAHLQPADVFSIGPTDEGGVAWNLDVSPTGQPSMGPHPIKGHGPHPRGIRLSRGTSSGWNAVYAVGVSPTPSPPAKLSHAG